MKTTKISDYSHRILQILSVNRNQTMQALLDGMVSKELNDPEVSKIVATMMENFMPRDTKEST